ncbi:hypothetical protein TRAPUB_13543 [Trametes pubescens]|uniref:Uncharacterized protein n=1 Tax=Trametes pubescens TaxID=154538 RepID=A0A1M2VR01_TRAPU|nr:hypothetical protein TRAPUB_13543 [Trametes pubescens]
MDVDSIQKGTPDSPLPADRPIVDTSGNSGSPRLSLPRPALYVPGISAALWLAYLATSTSRPHGLNEELWSMAMLLSMQAIPLELGYQLAAKAAHSSVSLAVRALHILSALMAIACPLAFRALSYPCALLRYLEDSGAFARFVTHVKRDAVYVVLGLLLDGLASMLTRPISVGAVATSFLGGCIAGDAARGVLRLGLLDTVMEDPMRVAFVAAAASVPSYYDRLNIFWLTALYLKDY